MYEKLNPDQIDQATNTLGKKVTVYFIGFCVFFIMVFFYSTTINVFFTVLVAFIFMGILLIYYMIGYVFVRLLRLLQFDNNFVQDLFNQNDNTEGEGDTKQDREEIPEI